MRRLKDIFYISANFNENFYIYYGMEFKQFVKYNSVEMENILITDGNYVKKIFMA